MADEDLDHHPRKGAQTAQTLLARLDPNHAEIETLGDISEYSLLLHHGYRASAVFWKVTL